MPIVERLPCAVIVPRIGVTLLPSGAIRKKPRLVVSRKSFVRWSMSSALTNGGFFVKSTRRSERGRSGAPVVDEPQPANASAARHTSGHEREPRHELPACASSQRASVVKPTMITSMAYCERAAARGWP